MSDTWYLPWYKWAAAINPPHSTGLDGTPAIGHEYMVRNEVPFGWTATYYYMGASPEEEVWEHLGPFSTREEAMAAAEADWLIRKEGL